jgi:S1-C subfamily serine protease/regulation of enolase protein 1 (concanavalin A-like superfamily)
MGGPGGNPVVKSGLTAQTGPSPTLGAPAAVAAADRAAPEGTNLPATPASSSAEALRKIKDATVYVKVRAGRAQGSGSGFVIRSEGDALLVATNHHVVNPHMARDEDDADPRLNSIKPVVTVVFRSGAGAGQEQTVPADVIAQERDGNRDLAILRVRGVKNAPQPIPFADNPGLTETTPVLICGFPFGNIDKMLDRSTQGNPAITINKGSVSSLRKDGRGRVSYVQIDGSVNPGNSGGPVVDEQGQLVGVSVAVISNTTIGFAIPPGELSRMFDGKVGRLSLALRDQSGATSSFQAEAMVIDPLNRIKSVEFLYAPETARAPEPRPDGNYLPLPNASRVTMNLNGRVASGFFQTEAGTGAPGRRLLLQASYRDGSGNTVYTAPVTYNVPARPTTLAAVGGSASPRALPPSFAALGDLVDPSKNCKSSRDAGSLTIELPAGVHLLSDEIDLKNSPMALADVEGDFLAQVKVPANMLPGTQPPKFKGKVLPFTYQGAGLVLWQDRNNYVRLERAAKSKSGRATLSSEVLVEVCKRGKPAGYFYSAIPDGQLYVRILRLNGAIQCMFGPDGRRWVSLKKLAIPFPEKIKLGLTASNASKELLSARFEDFVLITEKKKIDEEEKKD